MMKLTYAEIFKRSEILNPISPTALIKAAKLAGIGPTSLILDLGSGKAYPSLLWAGSFGSRIEGFDIDKSFVEYANKHAELLNLSHIAHYTCKDVTELVIDRKYDAVASLGLGVARVYGDYGNALRIFRNLLRKGGVLIFAEPVWLVKPVPPEAMMALGEAEDNLHTEAEMRQLLEEYGYNVLGCLASSREDWELYVRPIYAALRGFIDSGCGVAEEALKVVSSFEAEYEAVGRYWDMLLWVAETR